MFVTYAQTSTGKRRRQEIFMLMRDQPIITSRITFGLVLVVALTFAMLSGVAAHDIPNDVTVQVFVKPDGARLRLLVRAPLRACRDVDFPKRGPGYLDLARADAPR